MVTLKIDGREIQVQENSTVLEAALAAGVKIPTLCNLKDINQIGACRMCLVEDAKSGKLQASCALPVSEGMDIITNSPKVLNARRAVLELILSDHDRSCLTCKRNQTCELQALADELGVTELPYEAPMKASIPPVPSTRSPLPSCGITINASSAAAAWPPAT